MWEKRESLTANDNDLISASLKSFAPLPLEGADERSEAGLAFLNVGVPFHATNLSPIHHKAPDRKISDQGLSMRSHQRLSKDISRS